jgi:DNA primase
MRFPPQFLDQIRTRVNLSTVVGRRVQWDRRKTNASKGDFWACCPFHTEKSPSFHADDRKGRYHCFGCKASGDIFTFLVEKEGVPFPEAVERLAGEAGLPMPLLSEADVKREEQRKSLYDVMDLAQAHFAAELQSARGAKARGYLADREISPDIQIEFGIGYAPDDRAALRSHLAAKGVSVEEMAEAGLVITGDDIAVAYDRFRDRVMFPIRDARGRVIAFGGRALRADVPAKYLNSPETPIFSKGDVLYNFDKARMVAHQRSRLIAVEGYVDVIAMHRAGFTETVAPLGTALTERQLALLWRSVPEPILCFDGDAAGLKAAYRALDLALPLLQPGHSLRFVFLPEGKDPDDLLRSDGPAAVKQVIEAAQPMSDVIWQRALDSNDRATPERKASFEKELRVLLDSITEEGVRRHYLEDLRQRLAVLFQRTPSGGRTQRPFAGRQPFLKRGQKSWEVMESASPRLKAAARVAVGSVGADRRAEMIVLTFINHPELLHEFWDEFAAEDLPGRDLDQLRGVLLDRASEHDQLGNVSLRAVIEQRGFGPVLQRLDEQARRMNDWFVAASAATDDARTGLQQMFALHRRTVRLERELSQAEQLFAQYPTDENLRSLNAVRDQLQSTLGFEAHVDGFGSASGRPVNTET